jgi:hypothetical protein
MNRFVNIFLGNILSPKMIENQPFWGLKKLFGQGVDIICW